LNAQSYTGRINASYRGTELIVDDGDDDDDDDDVM
jgi:hypothetical protein